MKNANLLSGIFSFWVISGTVPAWAQDQGALLKAELTTITNPIPDNPCADLTPAEAAAHNKVLWRRNTIRCFVNVSARASRVGTIAAQGCADARPG